MKMQQKKASYLWDTKRNQRKELSEKRTNSWLIICHLEAKVSMRIYNTLQEKELAKDSVVKEYLITADGKKNYQG